MTDPVLCYVDSPWAYFTTQDLDKQWGDDWDDAPYDCNAGDPYVPYDDSESWEIVKVAFDGMDEPPEYGYKYRSVEWINKGRNAWLQRLDGTYTINAGTPLSEFKRRVREAGGRVYEEVRRVANEGLDRVLAAGVDSRSGANASRGGTA